MDKIKFPLTYKQSMIACAIIGIAFLTTGILGFLSIPVLNIDQKQMETISYIMLIAFLIIFVLGRKQHPQANKNKSDSEKN